MDSCVEVALGTNAYTGIRDGKPVEVIETRQRHCLVERSRVRARDPPDVDMGVPLHLHVDRGTGQQRLVERCESVLVRDLNLLADINGLLRGGACLREVDLCEGQRRVDVGKIHGAAKRIDRGVHGVVCSDRRIYGHDERVRLRVCDGDSVNR